MGMSILQRQQYSSFATHPTASSSPAHTNTAASPSSKPTLYKVKRSISDPRRHRRRDREFARGLKLHLLPHHARSAALVALASLRPIRDTILYRKCGIHQLRMAAMRGALKDRPDRPAPRVEHHEHPRPPIWALVRIRDRVLAEAERASMTAESPSGALDTLVEGKPSTIIHACGERGAREHE